MSQPAALMLVPTPRSSAWIETLCADGLALLVISSELEELVGYADRVIIMRDRKQVAEIPLAELSVPAIMNAIAA